MSADSKRSPLFSRKSLKVLTGLLILCLFCVGVGYIWAAGVSQSHVISSGVYSGAPSFTVWSNGDSYYYAKNAYGVITGYGSDFDSLVNECFSVGDGIVQLLEGSYVADSPLTPDAGDRLIGSGKSATWIVSSGDPIISFTGCDHVEIEDLTLCGNSGVNDGINILGTWDSVSNSFVILRDLVIVDCDTAVYADTMLWSTIDNVKISECVNGVYFNNGVVNNELNKIVIADCSGVGITVGVTTQRCEGLVFTDCVVFNQTSEAVVIDAGYEIDFQGCIFDYCRVDNYVAVYGGNTVRFAQCFFSAFPVRDDGLGCVMVYPSEAAVNWCQFEQCTFAYNGAWGLEIVESGTEAPNGCSVIDCVFTENGYDGSDGDLYIEDSDYTTVMGCQFDTVNEYSVLENAGSTHTVVIGCSAQSKYIMVLGTNSYGNLCWNATAWVT